MMETAKSSFFFGESLKTSPLFFASKSTNFMLVVHQFRPTDTTPALRDLRHEETGLTALSCQFC